MKLVPLCTMAGQRTAYSYSDPLPGGDRVGWVVGEGVVRGERLSGTLRRSNRPLHRADGVNVDSTDGVITTDGGPVFYSLRGIAVKRSADAEDRTIFASVTFRTAVPDHAWLNAVFCVAEATWDGKGGPVEYQVYECRQDDTRAK
jgi:hypothetical protein